MNTKQFDTEVLAMDADLFRHAMWLEKNNTNNAQDLKQECLYLVFKYRSTYKDNNLRAWVMTIMNNIYINNVKRRAKERVIDYKVEGKTYNNTNDTERLISQLPQHLKETFRMLVEGYKYKDIAEALGKPIGTIKCRINTARKILKKVYV